MKTNRVVIFRETPTAEGLEARTDRMFPSVGKELPTCAAYIPEELRLMHIDCVEKMKNL
jgi:hypothetical protein